MSRTASMTVLVLLASVIASLLTGCFTARIHLKVNWNGSAEMDVLMYAPRPLMVFSETSRLFNEIKSDLSARGFTVEDYIEDNRVGFRAFRKAILLSDFLSPEVEDTLVSGKMPSFTVKRHFFTSTYHIETEIDLGQLMEDDLEMTPLVADIRFLLTLPVRPSEHNAREVSEDGKTLEWILKTDSKNRIMVTATAPNPLAVLLIVLTVLIACAAFITLPVLRRRKPSAICRPPRKER